MKVRIPLTDQTAALARATIKVPTASIPFEGGLGVVTVDEATELEPNESPELAAQMEAIHQSEQAIRHQAELDRLAKLREQARYD